MKEKVRMVLYEDDFEKLVSGDVVENDEVQLILADIGYAVMMEVLRRVVGKYVEKQDGKH